ncbi:hypothetical protein ACFXCZ_35395 [Streptomyces sp. NPDC059396]
MERDQGEHFAECLREPCDCEQINQADEAYRTEPDDMFARESRG